MARTKTKPKKVKKEDSDQDKSDSEQDPSEDDQTNATSSRGSHDEDNSTYEDDQTNAGAEVQPKKRLLYHVRDNRKKRYVQAEIVTLRKDNQRDKFIMKSIEDNKIIHTRNIWFKGGCFPRGMGGKRVSSDYSVEQVVKPETSDSPLIHSESDQAKAEAEGYKTPTKRRRGSENADNNTPQADDHANAGAEAQTIKSEGLLYHVHDSSKKRYVKAEIVTLRKDNPQDKFIMKSIEDNKIIHARTIWFKGGCFPRGMGGKRVPSDYSEEQVVKPETSDSPLIHSESDQAKANSGEGYKTPTKRRRGSEDADNNAPQADDHANAGAEAQAIKRLLYHVRDNSKKRYVQAEIVTLRKDNPRDKFIMKSIEDNKIIHTRNIWFKGGCFPRGMGGKRVPSDYSEEQIVQPEKLDSGMVHSESDQAKAKAVPLLKLESKDHEGDPQACNSKDQGYETPTEKRRGFQDEDDSAEEDDRAKPEADTGYV
ncbi:uncharacterized protein [Ptychodera flava]|uniref:uncharacterized protein isoform X2 n=1 Tax=Ptychodera flava TaxID=63121 RepID=UPI003969DFEA